MEHLAPRKHNISASFYYEFIYQVLLFFSLDDGNLISEVSNYPSHSLPKGCVCILEMPVEVIHRKYLEWCLVCD